MRPLDVLESAYRLDGSDAEWVSGLVETVDKVFAPTGLGAAGYVFKGRVGADGKTTFESISDFSGRGVGISPSIADYMSTLPRWPAEVQERAFFSGSVANVASVVSGLGAAQPKHPMWRKTAFRPDLVSDSLGIVGHEGTLRGVMVCTPLPEVTSLTAGERRFWSRVAVHLGTALRLRSGADTAIDAADAVLSRRGKLLHLRNDADAGAIADGFERRRHARSRDVSPDAALEVWQGLQDGRWSLVDRVDTDGQTFVVAVRNEPARDVTTVLTDRQRAAVALAALGYGNKQIAYALGLSATAVAMLLRRARAATRVRSRLELVRAFKRSLAAEP